MKDFYFIFVKFGEITRVFLTDIFYIYNNYSWLKSVLLAKHN